jgi:hypothetical protein
MVLHEVIVGFVGYWHASARLASPVLLDAGRVHLGYWVFSFFFLIVVFDLLTCYFSGVVWWALVAAVAEYRYFGELFFSRDVLVVLQYI